MDPRETRVLPGLLDHLARIPLRSEETRPPISVREETRATRETAASQDFKVKRESRVLWEFRAFLGPWESEERRVCRVWRGREEELATLVRLDRKGSGATAVRRAWQACLAATARKGTQDATDCLDPWVSKGRRALREEGRARPDREARRGREATRACLVPRVRTA